MKTLDEIMNAVTAVTGVTLEQIRSKDRKIDNVRGLFYLIAYQEHHIQRAIAMYCHRARVSVCLVIKVHGGYFSTNDFATVRLYNNIIKELYKND